jgi:hypothetical protein
MIRLYLIGLLMMLTFMQQAASLPHNLISSLVACSISSDPPAQSSTPSSGFDDQIDATAAPTDDFVKIHDKNCTVSASYFGRKNIKLLSNAPAVVNKASSCGYDGYNLFLRI